MTAPEPYEKGAAVAYTIHRRGATLAGTGTIVHRHPNADSWSYAIKSAVDPARALFASHEELSPLDAPESESMTDATRRLLSGAGLDPDVFDREKARAQVQAELSAADPVLGTVLAHALEVMQAHEDVIRAVRRAYHYSDLGSRFPDVAGAFVHLCDVDPTAARP